MAKRGNYKVPFSYGGDLLHYVGLNGASFLWRDNEPFGPMILAIDKMKRGYSAKYTIWYDNDKHQYPMFVPDMIDLCKRGAVQFGITGEHMWMVRKRGQNYGICLAPDA